jgi:hypothetical protein
VRGLILAVAVVAALVIVARPRCGGWVLLSAAALLLPAHAGRPAHKPIVTAATLLTTVQAPSQGCDHPRSARWDRRYRPVAA